MDQNVKGYILSESDKHMIQRLFAIWDRMQHYVNAFGREPEDKIDHEEFHTTEVLIAKTPSGGIPALAAAASTGIGDTPGSALCQILRKNKGGTTTDEIPFSKTELVHNLSETAIDEFKWIIAVRDKEGSWFALPAAGDISGGGGGTVTGPGWIAGLSNEDCLSATLIAQNGNCYTIPPQTLYLESPTGEEWTSTDDFIHAGGSGPMILERPCSESMPKLTIDGECGIFEKAGTDGEGCYADFKFGTTLCGDRPGTGSGSIHPRGACCENTFTIRIRCTPCITPTTCCPNIDSGDTLYVKIRTATDTSGTTVATATLTWDGTYWVSPFTTVPCVVGTQDIKLRYTVDCVLQFTCDGTNWHTTANSGGCSIVCDPFCDPGHIMSITAARAGCGACNVIYYCAVSVTNDESCTC